MIFPDRWLVAEDTFRPPWHHLNVMSELGLIYGAYDAKPHGFVPGGISLHSSMTPHGPDREAFTAASEAELTPQRLTGTLAIMFETAHPQRVTSFAANAPERQLEYPDCWAGLEPRFEVRGQG